MNHIKKNKPFVSGYDERRKLKPRAGTGKQDFEEIIDEFLDMSIEDFEKMSGNIKSLNNFCKTKTARKALAMVAMQQSLQGKSNAMQLLLNVSHGKRVSTKSREFLDEVSRMAFDEQYKELLVGYANGDITADEFALYASKLKDATEITETIKKIDHLQESVDIVIADKKNER